MSKEPIGYTETETGYEPIFAPGPGYVVTQAFIMCRDCGGPISPCMGPRYNAVCLTCYGKAQDERTNPTT